MSEGHEAKPTDTGESDDLSGTDEAGERAQARTPWRESGSRGDAAERGDTPSLQTLADVYTKLNRITEKARQEPETQFRSLAHLLTVEMLREGYRRLRKNAAPGVDGVTAQEYEQHLEGNLQGLHRHLREGQYRAQPVRRVHIEKEDGKLRPLGVPALEDKIVQRAALMVLEAIYEQDFLPCSYGFREGRSVHDALDALQRIITTGKVSWVLDADIKGYFDNIVREHLMDFIQRRVVDGALLKLIGKWLHVGVVEDGRLLPTTKGTPQGAVISPWMANVYLHYVLDVWLEEEVKPRLRGEIHLIRYADDFVVCFQYQDDAERVTHAMRRRFEKYGLTLSEEKTRLIPFGRFAEDESRRRGGGSPPTFTFLGFTHYCGKSHRGKFAVKVRTASKRKGRTLERITEWCRKHLHDPLREQHHALTQKLRGHYQAYGRRTNIASLRQVYQATLRIWHRWLGRRTQRRRMTKPAFYRMLKRRPLPMPHLRRPRMEQLALW